MTHAPRKPKSPFVAALAIIACTVAAMLLTAPSATRATAQPRGRASPTAGASPERPFQPTTAPSTPVFPSRAADPAGATLATDPIGNVAGGAGESVLQSKPIPRKSAIPFVRQTIPDPDDRANTPTLPVIPEALPLMPKK